LRIAISMLELGKVEELEGIGVISKIERTRTVLVVFLETFAKIKSFSDDRVMKLKILLKME